MLAVDVRGVEQVNAEHISNGMVAMDGLEPSRPKARDFESLVYTNFTTSP